MVEPARKRIADNQLLKTLLLGMANCQIHIGKILVHVVLEHAWMLRYRSKRIEIAEHRIRHNPALLQRREPAIDRIHRIESLRLQDVVKLFMGRRRSANKQAAFHMKILSERKSTRIIPNHKTRKTSSRSQRSRKHHREIS